ncbi:MAG TPA: DUF1318 domain-containing protein [Thermodesulfovibrionales bacterium]|nr:DUF1318 domain-containing protein [Thermodesulfovibrionales bacterium]
MKKKSRFLILGVIVFIISCVTVNIYFPAAEVQKAADVIVEDVRQLDKKQEQKPQEQQKLNQYYQKLKKLSWGTAEAYAQIDIEVTTPAIRALKDSIKARFPQLRPFYDKGNVGESNTGFLENRDLGNMSLKEKADLSRLIEQENKDRKDLYAEIMKANKFGPDVLPQIQKIFANSWRDKSQSGWWIQKDSGEWDKKK